MQYKNLRYSEEKLYLLLKQIDTFTLVEWSMHTFIKEGTPR
jgi:hypothetical protein